MKMRTLLLVVGLLLIAYLLVLMVVASRSDEAEQTVNPFNRVQQYGFRAAFSQPFERDELAVQSGDAAACQVRSDHFFVATGAQCVFRLTPSERFTKTLDLRVPGETAVTLILVQANSVSVDEQLNEDQPSISLDIFRKRSSDTPPAQLTLFNCQTGGEDETESGCMVDW